MSFLNKIFQSIPVKIPDRSGFDLSHEVLSTADCGTVVPITHFEVLPGDTISMGSVMKVTLPPFAVPFMGRIDAELTAAFIPNRLLWKGWQSFITQNDGVNPSLSGHSNTFPITVPLMDKLQSVARGSLADYLGVNSTVLNPSALPFLAYHKFCDDWIRDDNLMKPFFSKQGFDFPDEANVGSGNANDTPALRSAYAHCMNSFSPRSLYSQNPMILPYASSNNLGYSYPSYFPDVDLTIGIGDLRQRCWAKDYFTTCTTRPQAGAASSVVFDTSGATGSFTIASLRAANSLQKWMERNNISGTEYGDQILAHFGVRPPDAVLNRSVLLGQVRTPVYVGSVTNNSASQIISGIGSESVTQEVSNSSPYGGILGSAAGFGSGSDKGSLVDNFTAKEHGFIMVFFTLIPHAYYDGGILRQNLHTTIGDFAWPEFAGIGDQSVDEAEVSVDTNTSGLFGYNQRYSEYKFLPDRVCGELASGQSMDVYALKRHFAYHPQLGSSFVEIPKDYLAQVFAYWEGGDNSLANGFSCMIDAYFDCKALRILPEYSLPHL